MEFDEVIDRRKSVRKFKSKKPDWRDIIEAIGSAVKIPLAGNLPNIKFILLDDAKKIREIAKCCQQLFISQAHYVIVVTSDPKEVIRSYDERGEKYCIQQAGAAIEQLLLKLVDLGLAGCWVGAFVDDHIKRALKIPAQVNVEAVIPIGYSFDKTRKKPKPDLDRVLRFNNYDQKFMRPKDEVEAF